MCPHVVLGVWMWPSTTADAACCSAQSALGSACAAQLAVQPAHLATTAFWTLRSAAAFIASRVGISATHVLVQHSMWHMVQVRETLSHSLRSCSTLPQAPFLNPILGVTRQSD